MEAGRPDGWKETALGYEPSSSLRQDVAPDGNARLRMDGDRSSCHPYDSAMTETMSKEQAVIVLESDIMQRVATRTVRLTLGGLIGAAAVMSLTALTGLVRNPIQPISFDIYLESTVPFAETVDPVLPTLVTALLALSVVKVGRFAPGFVVGTATLCGFLASTWATMSVLALFAPEKYERSAANDAVAGVGLGLVAVAVTVVLAEVLPLSSRVRERQLKDSIAKLEATRHLAGGRAARLLSHLSNRPYSPREIRWAIASAYVVTVSLPLVVIVAWGLGARTSAATAVDVAIVALSLSLVVLLELIAMHVLARFRLEAHGWTDERMMWTFLLLTFALGMSSLAILVPAALNSEFGGPFGYGLIPAAWAVILLVSGLLPLWVPLPKLGWFGQAAIVQRLKVLERRQERLTEIRLATDVDAMPDDRRPTRSRQPLLQRLFGGK